MGTSTTPPSTSQKFSQIQPENGPLSLFFQNGPAEKKNILPETNIFAPENMASQKESSLPTINFQAAMLIFGGVNKTTTGTWHDSKKCSGSTATNCPEER